jgi:integron integrase
MSMQEACIVTLFEALRGTFRRLHYSPRTEEAYTHWIRAFIRFHGRRHPRELDASQVTAFLNHLAEERRAAASTQNQALCAIVFLYRRVLDLPMPQLAGLERAQRPEHLPTVLSRPDVRSVLDQLEPAFRLIGDLMYGSGLRLSEVIALRVKDVDLERRQIMIRRGKGEHDRPALLPARLRDPLQSQIERVAARHRAELAAGRGEVDLPYALRNKIPSAASSLAWQYLVPASRSCTDPATGCPVLHHVHESAVQKAVTAAAHSA